MTAIEKMAKARRNFIAGAVLGDTIPLKESAIDSEKVALRALIDHIKETGAPEMVRAACRQAVCCQEVCSDNTCYHFARYQNAIIAALEEVIK